MAAVFTKAKDNSFKNTSFTIQTTNVNGGLGQGLSRLYDSIAPNAILNAGGRADEVRCHPGTRKEVIGLIDKWRLDIQNNVTANQMFWLSGPAGAGKTAIVQTVAESWKSQGVHIANFFFFRTDPSRNHAKPLVPTLLYQMFDFCPAAREAVDKILSVKPHILEAGFEEQVGELICATFRSIQPPFPQQIILLIDGLDECDSEAKASQKQILHILDYLVGRKDMPFLVLVASRAEAHILAAFRRLTSQAPSVFLDDQYSPERDIRLFVIAEFEAIKESHPHAALLRPDWPSNLDIEEIVRKSSGQFIYAATIMRFIAQSSAVPSLSLEKVQGIIPFTKNSPFVHLDAFYAYILQQADDDKAVRDILSSALLDERTTDSALCHMLPPLNEFLRLYDPRYTEPLFMSSISDISTIVQLHEGRLKFYHASLSDFLLDRSRSDRFHVDVEAFISDILPQLWKKSIQRHIPYKGYTAFLRLVLLDMLKHATPAIADALLTANASDSDTTMSDHEYGVFLSNISRLFYTQDIDSYKQILKHWIMWAVSAWDTHEDPRRLDKYCEPMAQKWDRWLGRQDIHDPDVIPLFRRYLFAARMRKQITKVSKVFKHR